MTTPTAARRGRTKRTGEPAETPVDHRSNASSSTGASPGSGGASLPGTMPASRSGRDWLTAPAAHSAWRRLSENDSENAPAVARASRPARVSAGLRRATSSMSR